MNPEQPSSLTDANPLKPVIVEDQPEKLNALQLPDLESFSHALKVMKVVIGPWARIRKMVRNVSDGANPDDRDYIEYEVGTDREGQRKIYGIDTDLQKACQAAIQAIYDFESSRGKLPRDVWPRFRHVHSEDTLSKKRMRLINVVLASPHFDAEQQQHALEIIETRPTHSLPRVKPRLLRPEHFQSS